MAVVIAFVAWSNTGKTTYLERLIPLLKNVGVRVGVLKHDGHDFDLDSPGTDTYRLTKSGADAVAIASPNGFAYLERNCLDPWEALGHFHDMDLILVEGYKRGPFPKIALYRHTAKQPLAVSPDVCLAIVSDVSLEAPCPVFPLNDPGPMVGFLLKWLPEKKGDCSDVHHP